MPQDADPRRHMMLLLCGLCLVMAAFTFLLCLPDGIVAMYTFSSYVPQNVAADGRWRAIATDAACKRFPAGWAGMG